MTPSRHVLFLLLAACDQPDLDTETTVPADASDADGDGFEALSAGGTDCDDGNADVHPGAEDAPYDGLDADCLGDADDDVDGDGWGLAEDCDDNEPGVNPDRGERCNGYDDDCDGVVDEDDAFGSPTFYLDADADGWGDEAHPTVACEAPAGFVAEAGDCEDADPTVYPGAAEICGDGSDQDCDGISDGCGPIGDLEETDASARFEGAAYTRFGTVVETAGDLDADGAPDVLVLPSHTYEGFSGSVFTHAASGSATDADIRLYTTAFSTEPLVLHGGFDMDANGLDELLVATTDWAPTPRVYLLEAPLSGDVALSDVPTYITVADDRVAALGSPADFDLDGEPDVPIGLETGSATELRIVAGPLTTPRSTVDSFASIAWDSPRSQMGALLSPGDLDGDGFADLISGNSLYGEVFVYAGPIAGTLSSADADAYLLAGAEAGARLVTADLLGEDGHPEVVVGRIGRVLIFETPMVGTLTPEGAIATVEGDSSSYGLGTHLDALGDVDADGQDDLGVGAPGADGGAGAVYIFHGPLTGSITPDDAWGTIVGEALGGLGRIAGPGDVDGDGFADILVAADEDGFDDEAGHALLFRGGGGW